MAIGTTPLFSKISGSVGPVDYRTRRNGKIEIGKKRIPANPQSTEQQNTRTAYGRLYELWQNAAWIDKTQYENIAAAYDISPWNAFLMRHLSIMRLNPVAYWPFVEGTGNTLHDFSTNENHGIISGADWQNKGPFDLPMLYFDGIDDTVNCGGDSSLKMSDTVSSFVTISSHYTGVITTPVCRNYGWMINGPKSALIEVYGNDGTDGTFKNSPWLSEYDYKNIHIGINCREYTGDWTIQGFINNIKKGPATHPLFNGPAHLVNTYIGSRNNNERFFLGDILEVVIFDYITSEKQNTQIYNKSKQFYGV